MDPTQIADRLQARQKVHQAAKVVDRQKVLTDRSTGELPRDSQTEIRSEVKGRSGQMGNRIFGICISKMPEFRVELDVQYTLRIGPIPPPRTANRIV